jgi:hypothetical protein
LGTLGVLDLLLQVFALDVGLLEVLSVHTVVVEIMLLNGETDGLVEIYLIPVVLEVLVDVNKGIGLLYEVFYAVDSLTKLLLGIADPFSSFLGSFFVDARHEFLDFSLVLLRGGLKFLLDVT